MRSGTCLGAQSGSQRIAPAPGVAADLDDRQQLRIPARREIIIFPRRSAVEIAGSELNAQAPAGLDDMDIIRPQMKADVMAGKSLGTGDDGETVAIVDRQVE